MHFRGYGGQINRLARRYCAARYRRHGLCSGLAASAGTGRTPLAAVGYSLGGNALLKWLSEAGAAIPLRAAVAISIPFLLDTSTARRLGRGFSRLYQAHLLRQLKRSYRNKFGQRADGPVPLAELVTIRDFYGFDDRITAPLHGYAGVHDYYAPAPVAAPTCGISVPRP